MHCFAKLPTGLATGLTRSRVIGVSNSSSGLVVNLSPLQRKHSLRLVLSPPSLVAAPPAAEQHWWLVSHRSFGQALRCGQVCARVDGGAASRTHKSCAVTKA